MLLSLQNAEDELVVVGEERVRIIQHRLEEVVVSDAVPICAVQSEQQFDGRFVHRIGGGMAIDRGMGLLMEQQLDDVANMLRLDKVQIMYLVDGPSYCLRFSRQYLRIHDLNEFLLIWSRLNSMKTSSIRFTIRSTACFLEFINGNNVFVTFRTFRL